MKDLVIGLFCIFLVQKASSAPKWSNLTIGQPVDDLELITDYDFTDTELDYGKGTCFYDIDLELTTDNDFMDTDFDYGNGTCLYDDDSGLLLNDPSFDMDLDYATGLCFDNGTGSDYYPKNMDYGSTAEGPSATKKTGFLSLWKKTASLLIAATGFVCLMRVLRIIRKKKAKLVEKRPRKHWKFEPKGKPDKTAPWPMDTDEQTQHASQPDCLLQDLIFSLHGVSRDIKTATEDDSERKSSSGMCLEDDVITTGPYLAPPTPFPDESQLDECLLPNWFYSLHGVSMENSRDIETTTAYDSEWNISSGTCLEEDVVTSPYLAPPTAFPDIDPEFIRFIESFDWDSIMPPALETSSGTSPAAVKDEKVPDAKRHLEVIPAWKLDIRKYLADLPEGVLERGNRNGKSPPADGKPPVSLQPPMEESDLKRRMPKKKVSFCEDVAVKRLFFGRNCPFVPKPMRKSLKIRMIGDILPLKGDGDGKRFKFLRRSKKIISLLRF